MADTYRLDNTNSDLSGGADFSKKLLTSGFTSGSISVTVAASATETSYGFTEAPEPGASGTSTGSFSVEVNVTTGTVSLQGSVTLSRVNAAGSVQATSAATAEQSMSAGLKTFSLTDPAMGTWAAGDRLRVNYILRNTNSMATSTLDFDLGTSNAEVSVPWTYVPPGGGSTSDFLAMF